MPFLQLSSSLIFTTCRNQSQDRFAITRAKVQFHNLRDDSLLEYHMTFTNKSSRKLNRKRCVLLGDSVGLGIQEGSVNDKDSGRETERRGGSSVYSHHPLDHLFL